MLTRGLFLHRNKYLLTSLNVFCHHPAVFNISLFYFTWAHQHAVLLVLFLSTVAGSCWAGSIVSWQCLLALFLSCICINHLNIEYWYDKCQFIKNKQREQCQLTYSDADECGQKVQLVSGAFALAHHGQLSNCPHPSLSIFMNHISATFSGRWVFTQFWRN